VKKECSKKIGASSNNHTSDGYFFALHTAISHDARDDHFGFVHLCKSGHKRRPIETLT